MRLIIIFALLLCLVPTAAAWQVPTPTNECPTVVSARNGAPYRAVTAGTRLDTLPELYVVREGLPEGVTLAALWRVWQYVKSLGITPHPEQQHWNRSFLWIDANWIQGDTPCSLPPAFEWDAAGNKWGWDQIGMFYSFDNDMARLWGVIAHEFAHSFGAAHTRTGGLEDAYIWYDIDIHDGIGARAYLHTCREGETLCYGLEKAIYGR